MKLDIVEIASLDEPQLAALELLLVSAFPADPPDLLRVEVARAGDSRLGRGLVAVRDGAPVGAVLARKPRAGSMFVVYLAVAAPLRRRGLARSLLDQLSEVSGERLELLVTDGNIAAERLYRNGGLRPVEGPSPPGQRRWIGAWQPRRHRARIHRPFDGPP